MTTSTSTNELGNLALPTLSRNTKRAVAKYGRDLCIKAYNMNRKDGEGARTIALTLCGLTNTASADAAINAGAELLSVTAANLAAINARAKSRADESTEALGDLTPPTLSQNTKDAIARYGRDYCVEAYTTSIGGGGGGGASMIAATILNAGREILRLEESTRLIADFTKPNSSPVEFVPNVD